MIKLGEVVMILDLHRQGLSVSAIARQLGIDRKTVRKYIARGLEPPVYGPRKPRPRRHRSVRPYLRERVKAYPGLTGAAPAAGAAGARLPGRLHRRHGLPARRAAAAIRHFEVRFETPPGDQAQVDFAHFQVVFTDEPERTRIVWLFSMVLGYQPPDLGALRPAPGPADRAALPRRGVRGARRRAARDPLRPHEDRGSRRAWSAASSTIAR